MCIFGQQRNISAVSSLKVYDRNKRLINGGTIDIGSGLSMNKFGVDKKVALHKRVAYGCWKPISDLDKPNQQTLALTYGNCIYLYNSQPKNVKNQP